MSPRFLTLSEILEFHEELIRDFGGSPGVRDLGLAESAIAMPQAGAGGEFFHAFPFEMAAAYAYHIAQNHPFIDGNKRTAFSSALTFLELNGYPVMGGEDELEAAIRKVASGKLDKKGLVVLLEKTYNHHKQDQAMREIMRKRLEAAGQKIGTSKEFLGLSTPEADYLEIKLKLA